LLKTKQIPCSALQPSTETPQSKISAYIDQKNNERVYNDGVASYHGIQSAKEIADRKTFRKDFITKVGTDFSKVPLNGVLAADGDNIQEKNNQTVTQGIARANDALGAANADGVPVNLYLT